MTTHGQAHEVTADGITTNAVPKHQGFKSFRPLGERIVIRAEKAPDRVGLIFLPDSAKKQPAFGRIVSMGPGMKMYNGKRWPMPDVRPGQRVVITSDFLQHAPRVNIRGEELHIVGMNDILAVFEEDDGN